MKWIDKHLTTEQKATIQRIWPQNKRYTRYRGITVSWDADVDKDVWTTNIDTVFLHKRLEDSGLLRSVNIKRAGEIGVGGGHGATMLGLRIPNLKELIMTDISMYALRTSKRNALPYLTNISRRGPPVRLRTYLGKGLETIEDYIDLLMINPPYIPTSPYETRPHTDPYRGTGLIREVLSKGIEKLNPRNSDASLIINISSLAQKDFDKYVEEFGSRLEIEKVGEPLEVPLKIRSIDQRWKDWLVHEGLLRFDPAAGEDQEAYWHTLQVYRIRPKAGAVKTWSAREKDKVESRIYSDTETLVSTFRPFLNETKNQQEDRLRRMFPELHGYLFQKPEEMNFDSQEAPVTEERNLSLVKHIFERGFSHKLLGLEKQDIRLFQAPPGFSESDFNSIADMVARADKAGLLPYLRAALLYHDISKSNAHRLKAEWSEIEGIDFQIPNKAAAMILRNLAGRHTFRKGLFENIPVFDRHPHREILNEFFYRVMETRGFPGQWIRGEITYDLFQDFTDWIRANFSELAQALGTEGDAVPAAKRISEIVYLFNFIDTASVRDDLMTRELNRKFQTVFDRFENVITPHDGKFETNWPDVFDHEWNRLIDDASRRAYLKDRLGRFRKDRRDLGEPVTNVDEVIDHLSPKALRTLTDGLIHFQGWYVENATFELSAEAMIKLISLALALAKRKGLDTSKLFNITFFKLMHELEI